MVFSKSSPARGGGPSEGWWRGLATTAVAGREPPPSAYGCHLPVPGRIEVRRPGAAGLGGRVPPRASRDRVTRDRRLLQLADEVERRSEGLLTLFPRRRADLAGVVAHVLRGADLAGQFVGVAADALAGDL